MTRIPTFTGRSVDLLNPRPEQICIDDVAHALANLCRFTGHTDRHYSVAQHSVMVARSCPPELALQGLLHDAHEAYIGDWSAPLKRSLSPIALAELHSIEAGLIDAISKAPGVKLGHHPTIKFYDRMALGAEAETFITGPIGESGTLPRSVMGEFVPWPAEMAEQRFLSAYRRLRRRSPVRHLASVC